MPTPALIDPVAVARAAIAAGLLIPAPPAPPALTTEQMIRRKRYVTVCAQKRVRLSPELADERRRQIHAMKAAGYESKEIARKLGISRANANNYLRNP